MSVSSEITRIKNAKSSLKNAINNKLVSDKITNETIDDYAEKVNSIAIPSGEVIEGALKTATNKGNNLEKSNCIYESETNNLVKVTANYFIDFSTNSIKLLKYIDDKIVTIDNISEISSSSVYEIFENNGDYYIVFQQNSSNISVLYTDLNTIDIVDNKTISLNSLQQVDYNKFINYTTDKTNKKIQACPIVIIFNKENTSINLFNSSSILNTTKDIDTMGINLVGQNRFAFWMSVHDTSTRNFIIIICMIDANNGTISEIHRDSSISSGYSSFLPTNFAVYSSGPGVLVVAEKIALLSVIGHYTINDSQMIYTADTTSYKNTSWEYNFSLSQVIKRVHSDVFLPTPSDYTYELYSFNQYSTSFIKDVSYMANFFLTISAITPKSYKDSIEKTEDDLIFIIDILTNNNVMKVYKDSLSSENLQYYYYSSLSGGYISAEAGEIGDKIKIYSPSIE